MPEFLTESPENIVRTLHPPEGFFPDSFEAVPMGVGITMIVGRPSEPNLIQQLINPERVLVQSVKFDKPEWTLEEALKWVQDHHREFTNYQHKKSYAANLKEIKGVEIFSAGTWNGDTYTVDDLDGMVLAFNETQNTIRPAMKLGHPNKQALLQAEGLPAAGWIGRLYREGEKLVADLVDIPQKIFELIDNKAYRKVSSEIYLGVEIAGRSYEYLVGGLALLGSELPGCMNLSDIMARYGLTDYDSVRSYIKEDQDCTVKLYSITNDNEEGGHPMPKSEREIELELQLKQAEDARKLAEADSKQFKADMTSNDELLKAEKEKAEAAEKRAFAAEQQAHDALVESQVGELVAEKVITAGMKPYVTQLLAGKADVETKKYSFKAGDSDKSLTKYELIKEFAKQFSNKADVNLEEGSEAPGDVSNNKGPSVDEIEQYATEKKLNFSAAYKELLAGKLSQGPEETQD